MKAIDYYKICSNTEIQKSKIKKVLPKKYNEDYIEDGLREIAEIISYCCRNYKQDSSIPCPCKYLPECQCFNNLVLKYSSLLKEYRK